MEPSSRRPERGLLLISNLPALQNLIKRDPDGYSAEFATQWDHYQSLRAVIDLGLGSSGGNDLVGPASVTPTSTGAGSGKGRRETEEKFREVVIFLSQTAPCYALKAKPIRPVTKLPSELSSLLLQRHDLLHTDTRKSLVQALVGMRRKDTTNCLITTFDLLQVLFALLPMTTSSVLRASILKTILTDIKLANKKTKNHKLNRSVQGLLFNMIERGIDGGRADGSEGPGMKRKLNKNSVAANGSRREALWAVKLATELWRKGIWDDSKTIRILSDACFHSNTKVQSAAIHFFLSDSGAGDGLNELDSDNDQEKEINVKQVKHVQTINKKRKSTDKRAEKMIKQANRKQRAKEAGVNKSNPNFSAIQLIHDPPQLGEKLYEALLKHDKIYTLDHKILLLQLFSRISAIHKLQVLPFYSYILKYINHQQLQVTSILAALAQSVHELTPPDVLMPCLRKLANEFVHPGVASTVIAAGLNSITEISRRQPLAMEADLLADLIEYKKSKDKGIITAARSLLGLFREVNPSLLRSRERGKVATMASKDSAGDKDSTMPSRRVVRFGETRGDITTIPGLELLEQAIVDKGTEATGGDCDEDMEDEDDKWEGWEVESDDSHSASDEDSGGSWIEVSSEDDEGMLNVSDSSDDEDVDGEKITRRQRLEKRRKIFTGGWKAGEDTRASRNEEQDGEQAVEDGEESDDPESPAEPQIASLASTKILTPADFAKLNELRISAIEKAAKESGSKNANSSHHKILKQLRQQAHYNSKEAPTLDALEEENHRFVSEGDIIGQQKKAKQTYEERMESIQSGRDGREKFGSSKVRGRKGLKNGAMGSSTNEAKSRQKSFAMTQQSNRVRSKKSASLRDRQKTLRAHINRKKRGGRRGNG
ncbi:SDA1-domain-containing protein [Melampsora americana]|nr:SDA1-domain-containing protein [Melampsora americana]